MEAKNRDLDGFGALGSIRICTSHDHKNTLYHVVYHKLTLW